MRSFTLPEDADGSKVSAEYKEGVLEVYLPKAEKAKPRSIGVKSPDNDRTNCGIKIIVPADTHKQTRVAQKDSSPAASTIRIKGDTGIMFRNREEAGRILADKLSQYSNDPTGLILALPRGGVAVGYQLSLALHLPLNVFMTRKIGAPENPEYAIGALAETGSCSLNQEAVNSFGLSQHELNRLIHLQEKEIARRKGLYRQGLPLPQLTGRTVLLVDDGIATGSTFIASALAIRSLQPRRLVGVIPVGPPSTIHEIRSYVDELVILMTPDPFYAVGNFFIDFTQVEDRDVIHYLNLAEKAILERAPSSPAS